ncbi:MAG: ABC transporter substrate-binding protein [Treponema sp.]|jgi:raffinose/stachyose/melibiose transport system substrate-binding protein|nr:ABC transporter substrate-binding protein [Treponema sp.]
MGNNGFFTRGLTASLLLPLAAGIMTLMVASCEKTTGTKININVISNKAEISRQFLAAAETYMKQNPQVNISAEFIQGNSYSSSLRAKMMGADAPELFVLNGPVDFRQYAEYLEDLSGEPWVPYVAQGLLDDARLDGKVVAMPVVVEGFGIIYNKEILTAAGIDASQMNSYDSIEKGVRRLKEVIDSGALKNQYPVLDAPMEYAAKEPWVLAIHCLGIGLGVELGSATGAANAKTINFTYAESQKKLLDLLTSYTSSGSNRGLLNAVDYSTQVGGSLGIERVAMIQQGNWISPELRNVAPDVLTKLDMLPMPLAGVVEDRIGAGVPTYWCINLKSSDEEQKATKEFLNWLYQSEEGKKIIVEEFGFIPVFTNYEGLEVADPLGAAVQRYIREEKIITFPFSGFPSGFESKAASEMQSYLAGNMTWDQTVKAIKADWTDLTSK